MTYLDAFSVLGFLSDFAGFSPLAGFAWSSGFPAVSALSTFPTFAFGSFGRLRQRSGAFDVHLQGARDFGMQAQLHFMIA